MANPFLIHEIQLEDFASGQSIIDAGGTVAVCAHGTMALLALKDPADLTSALSNPLTLTRGMMKFAVADTVNSVDIYGIAPGGQAFQQMNVKAGALPMLGIDLTRSHFQLVIPFDHADFTAATEELTGFVEPTGALFLPNPCIWVEDIDATEDIDVGTDSGDSGDADGFMDGVSVGTAGLVKATLLASGDTMGALFSVLDSANAGDDAPEGHVSTGKEISYTLSTGSDTAAGLIILPYMLVPIPA